MPRGLAQPPAHAPAHLRGFQYLHELAPGQGQLFDFGHAGDAEAQVVPAVVPEDERFLGRVDGLFA
jgi:hypothetical protein